MSQHSDPSTIVLTYDILGYQDQVTFGQLENSSKEFIRYGIIHGMAIGIGSFLMFMSWIIIINKKTPMFVLNQCSLLLLLIRSSLYLAYVMGPLAQVSFTYTGIYTGSWTPYNVSLAANIVYCFLVFTVEATMVYQVYIVFKGSKLEKVSRLLLAVCAALGITTVGFSTNAAIHSAIMLKSQLKAQEYILDASWVTSVPCIMLSVTINLLSMILILKLYVAIRTRRVLGLKQFDSFHILIIILTQTLIVPSVLVIVNYLRPSTSLLSSLSFIIVVLNLPLGSLWASSSNRSPLPTSVGDTVLSRYSSISSQGTLTTSGEEMYLQKCATPPTANTEKALGSASSFDDLESLERILETFENSGIITVTNNSLRNC